MFEGQMKKHKLLADSLMVKSIDLVDSTYIIYLTKGDSVFKIVSPLLEPLFTPPFLKNKQETCNKISVGKYYTFKLKSIFEFQFGTIDPESNRRGHRAMGPHLKAVKYNGSFITLEAECQYDVYTTENLKGLCYLDADSLQRPAVSHSLPDLYGSLKQ